jgi:hypothetical protein
VADATLSAETSNLITDLIGLYKRFIVIDYDQAVILALWVLHTHAIKAADQTPYIHVTSAEKRCAKSMVLELSEKLAAKSLRTSNTSVAALYRFIESAGTPTLQIDEMDAIWAGHDEKNEELRGILNAGNRRGAKVLRCEQHGQQLRVYEVFGPKMLAGIGGLPDTIADRCIPIHMKRKLPSEYVERFRVRQYTAAANEFDARLEEWGERAVGTLTLAEPDLPDELNDRQQDACEPLLAIADMAGKEWADYARHALTQVLDVDEEADSLQMRCLRDCRTVIRTQEPEPVIVPSHWMVTSLACLEDGPWATIGNNGLSANYLSRLLGNYGIHPDQHWFVVDGENKQLRGYVVADFKDSWDRFLGSDSSSQPPDSLAVLRL